MPRLNYLGLRVSYFYRLVPDSKSASVHLQPGTTHSHYHQL